jgi:hypothetical protein
VLVLPLGPLLMVVVEMVLMLRYLNDYALIESRVLMHHYVLIQVLLYRYLTDLILRLKEQNLLELVLLVSPLRLCVSFQMLDLLYQLLFLFL